MVPAGDVATTAAPRAASAAALAFDRVGCTFASNDDGAARHVVLDDVTLDVAPAEFVSVVGPTGCGKSTLLNVAAGLLAPSSGEVRVFGARLDARAGLLNRRAGYMFQADALMPWRDALANVIGGPRVPRRRSRRRPHAGARVARARRPRRLRATAIRTSCPAA